MIQKSKKVASVSENLVLQAIVGYIGKDSITNIVYEPNKCTTAPDFEFDYKKTDVSIKKIILEVVDDFGCTYEENTSTVKKWAKQDRLKGFRRNLNKLDNSWISNNESITVSFLTKIPSKKECGISLSELVQPCHKKIKALY